jgi:hypothetical protein
MKFKIELPHVGFRRNQTQGLLVSDFAEIRHKGLALTPEPSKDCSQEKAPPPDPSASAFAFAFASSLILLTFAPRTPVHLHE